MAKPAVTKRRQPPPQLPAPLTPSSSEAEGITGFARWDIEQDYENRPRKKRKHEKEDTRLPIKTAEGRIERSRLPDLIDSKSDVSDDSDPDEVPQGNLEVDSIEETIPQVSPRQQIIDAKEELAKIAGFLNEDPEENVRACRIFASFRDVPPGALRGPLRGASSGC